MIESVTYHWLGHSSSDPIKYRTREEVEEWKKKRSIENLRKYLLENGASAEGVDQASRNRKQLKLQASAEAIPLANQLFEDIYELRG